MNRKKFNKTAGERVDEALHKFFTELVESKDGKVFANLDDVNLIKTFARAAQFSFQRGFESAMAIAGDLIDEMNAKKATENKNVLSFNASKKRDFEIH